MQCTCISLPLMFYCFVYTNGLVHYCFPPVVDSSYRCPIVRLSHVVFGSFSRGIPIGPCTTHPYVLLVPRHSGVNLLPLYT